MVEVNGRSIESNGCTRGMNCFECEQKDCTAGVQEIYLLDSGKSIEEVKVWRKKNQERANKYHKNWRDKKKENLNNGC